MLARRVYEYLRGSRNKALYGRLEQLLVPREHLLRPLRSDATSSGYLRVNQFMGTSLFVLGLLLCMVAVQQQDRGVRSGIILLLDFWCSFLTGSFEVRPRPDQAPLRVSGGCVPGGDVEMFTLAYGFDTTTAWHECGARAGYDSVVRMCNRSNLIQRAVLKTSL